MPFELYICNKVYCVNMRIENEALWFQDEFDKLMESEFQSKVNHIKEWRKSMTSENPYEQKLQAQLDEWSAEIDKLKAKADKAEADARIDYEKQIEELKAMQNAAYQKLNEFRKAGDAATEDMKSGIEKAFNALNDAIKSASSRF